MKIGRQNRVAIAMVIAFVLSAIFIRGCYMAVRGDKPVETPELIILENSNDTVASGKNSRPDSVKTKKEKSHEKKRPQERSFLDERVPSGR